MPVYKIVIIFILLSFCQFLLSNTLQFHSQHFVIFHSNRISHYWIEKTVNTLEQAHNKTRKLFNYSPVKVIPVIIYDQTWEFTRATKLPYYIGAIYDGTIKMQHPQILEKRDILKSTLTHEYTHAVLDKLTHSNIPLWLNEGLAINVAEQNPISSYNKKIKSFQELNQLLKNKKSKTKLSFAYFVSNKIVKQIIKQYSWSSILKILNQLNCNKSIELAVNHVFKMKYHLFEKKILRKIHY